MTSEMEAMIKAHANDLKLVQIIALILAVTTFIIGFVLGYVVGRN